MISALGLKLVSLFSILLVSIIFSLIPILFRIKNERLKDRLLSIGNAFAGGVFLGGGFSHLLPEAAHKFEELGQDKLPIPHILAVTAFLIIFLLEQVIFSHKHEHSFVSFKDEENGTVDLPTSSSPPSSTTTSSITLEELPTSNNNNSNNESNGTSASSPSNSKSKSFFLPIILTIVLSIHSIIAGFAIGVQEDTPDVLALFVAVIAHKWTESFALGVSLVKNKVTSKMQFVKFILSYSIMAPLGILAGIILSYAISGNSQLIVDAIISSFASGTFIYIALVDILLKEFVDPTDKYWKYVVCWIGFALITGSIILFDDD